MNFQSFYDKFPTLAEKETRRITVFENNDYGLPAAEYAFVELFCNDKKCDCRRVFLTVFSLPQQKNEATICWGWENIAFYKKWLGFIDKKMIDELIGPCLNSGSPQSPLAPALLKLFSQVLLIDNNYTNRVKTHYAMFKKKRY